MRTSFLILFFLPLLITGCRCGEESKKRSPRQVVMAYLEKVFNITDHSEKDDLLRLTTGDLKATLINTDKETFERDYIRRKIDVESFEVTDVEVQPKKKAIVTFKLQYKEIGEGSEDLVRTVENHVGLVMERDRWYIEEIMQGDSVMDFLIGKVIRVKKKVRESKTSSNENNSTNSNKNKPTNEQSNDADEKKAVE